MLRNAIALKEDKTSDKRATKRQSHKANVIDCPNTIKSKQTSFCWANIEDCNSRNTHCLPTLGGVWLGTSTTFVRYQQSQ